MARVNSVGDRMTMEVRLCFLLIAVLSVGCSTVDLRPEAVVRAGVSEDLEARGREVLARMVEAHGGMETWREHGAVAVTVRDEWPGGLTRMAAHPWPEHNEPMRMFIGLGQDNVRIEFLEGEAAGHAWGIQQWVTYTVEPGQEPVFVQDDDIWFWLPTISYFFELPFRISEATVVAYDGESELGGETFDRVFATWSGAAPRDDVDQYRLWIERETGLLRYAEYTVRDYGSWMKGTMYYDGYHEVDGIQVPAACWTVDAPGETEVGMHKMHFEKVDFQAAVSPDMLVPDPDLRAEKSDGGAAR